MIGKTLQNGKYKIIKLLGQGGFGITYLAEQVMLGRKVAVKEFFIKYLCNRDNDTSHVSVGSTGNLEMVERFKEKFLKEARIIAKMENNHIVRIHDIFEENGTAYYIMEYIDGGSVDELVKNNALSENQAIKIVFQIGEALSYIHAQNVLHLDVKPSNILLRPNGDAVLIDFGISKRYDVDGEQTSTTPTGVSKGFAPIEQYNQGLRNFSPATDVYSLGATLYKMLTGQTPPEAPTLLDTDEFPVCPFGIRTNLWKAIEKAMNPRRKYRFQNVVEFISALNVQSSKTYDKHIASVTDSPLSVYIGTDFQTTNLSETTIIKEKQINANGNPYVDLGLSVKWAKFNLGADTEFDAGAKFPFSLISDTPEYICGNPSYDVCRKKMGGSWRLPTKQEQDELRQKCKWVLIDNIYKVIGPNGNHIHLPAAEAIRGGFRGAYWSGNLHMTNKMTAYYLYFNTGLNDISWMNADTSSLMLIRGVID